MACGASFSFPSSTCTAAIAQNPRRGYPIRVSPSCSASSPSPSSSSSSSSASASSSAAPPSWSPPRVELVRFNDDSSAAEFSPLICGCYSLAGGHGYIYERDFLDAMELYARAGFSTFDTADIYGPSEATCGKFLRNWSELRAAAASPLPEVRIFTKFVPNLFSNKPTFSFVEKSLQKSMRAIGVPKLDLVQLHWWDYSMKGMLDVALSMADLRGKGMVGSIGTTNMSTEALAKIVDAGVPVVSNQVQCSLIDRRPLRGPMLSYCKEKDIKLLAYGSLAGGVLTNRYLGDRKLVLKTSSLRMYSRILKEAGGEKHWRKLLGVLSEIAARKSVGIATIALRWVMQQGPIYPVVGMSSGEHFEENLKAFCISLDERDLSQIDETLRESSGPRGDCYEIERNLFG